MDWNSISTSGAQHILPDKWHYNFPHIMALARTFTHSNNNFIRSRQLRSRSVPCVEHHIERPSGSNTSESVGGLIAEGDGAEQGRYKNAIPVWHPLADSICGFRFPFVASVCCFAVNEESPNCGPPLRNLRVAFFGSFLHVSCMLLHVAPALPCPEPLSIVNHPAHGFKISSRASVIEGMVHHHGIFMLSPTTGGIRGARYTRFVRVAIAIGACKTSMRGLLDGLMVVGNKIAILCPVSIPSRHHGILFRWQEAGCGRLMKSFA